MGEILNMLVEKRERLLQKKAYLQNAAVEISILNAQISKLNQIISWVEAQGG